MANHALPTLASVYTDVFTQLDDRFDDQAKMFDPATTTTTVTGIPTNTIRWNSATNNWTKFNGSSWVALSNLYAISVSGTADNVTGVVAIANGGTGGTTATAARTSLGLGSLAVLNTVNNANWSGTALAVSNGGTGASDASSALTNLGVSTYSKTLLDDTSASAALTTLGVSEYSKTLLDDISSAAARTTLGISNRGQTESVFAFANGGQLLGVFNTFVNMTPDGPTINKGTAFVGDTFTAPRSGHVRCVVSNFYYTVVSSTVSSVKLRFVVNGIASNPEFLSLIPNERVAAEAYYPCVAGDTFRIAFAVNGDGSANIIARGIVFEMVD